jgi:hypothetical protein
MVMATIGAASLGRFDGRPGDDLASIVAAACGDAPDRAERGDLVAARLSDGATIPMAAGDIIPAPIVDQDPTTFLDPSVPPVPVYLDPLGRGSITGIDGGSYPLAVASAGDRAAWLVSLDTSPGAGVHVRPTDLVVQKVRAGSDPVRIIDLELRPNLEAWSDAHVGDGYRSQGPAGFIGDVDADGCPELVAPLLTIPCATSPDALPQAGPSWIGTRPFGVVEGRQRRLLVAASLEWLVPGGGLLPPSPVGALAALGGWRTTGSVPFAIGELRAQDLLYFPRFPVPSPTFDPATGRERPEAVVAGRAGERILARIEAIDPAMVEAAAVDISLAEFLETGLGPGTLEPVFQRTAVRPGGLSGVDDLAHRIPLLSPDATSEASAWRVTAVTVNDWGEISGPVQGSILVDVVGPALVLEPPSASLPWPLTATLQGTTESRATIEVVGGPTVTADRRGRYEVALSLAPWPQDITLHATDDNGNRTTRTVSVMAGLDVRQLPWQGFIVLGVFGAVAYAVVRDGRRATPASLATHRWTTIDRRGLAVDFDADEASPGATIEELDPVPRT